MLVEMKNSFRSLINKMRYKSKIIASLYISTIIISIAFVIYFSSANKHQALNEAAANGVAFSDQVLGALSYLIDDIETLSNTFFLDSNIQTFMERNKGIIEENEISLYPDKANFFSGISNTNCITAYAVFNDVGTLIDSVSMDNSCVAESVRLDAEKKLFEHAQELNGKPYWFEIDSNQRLFLSRNASEKIACLRAIKDRNIKNIVGYALLMINKSKIRDICIRSQIDSTALISIEGKGGIVFYANGNDDKVASNNTYSSESSSTDTSPWVVDEKNGYIRTISVDTRNDLRINYRFSISDIQKRVLWLELFSLIITICCLVLFFPVFFGVSTYLMRPINQLLDGMQHVKEGDFKTRVTLDERSEIDALANGFNDMVANLDKLISENYILQIKEKDAEIKALQACMNPHFIYNTLDIIYWQAENNNQPEIAQTVLNLSRMLRLSLKFGQIYTTVKDEIELVSRYLSLQQLRFGDLLNYEIQVDPEAENCMIPQYLMEPFIENAVVHGLYQKGGRLDLSVKKEGNILKVLIIDNGVGISQEKLEALLSENSVHDKTSYAIFNIAERLKLLYGEQYVFKIESEVGEGTRVYIQIPTELSVKKGDEV